MLRFILGTLFGGFVIFIIIAIMIGDKNNPDTVLYLLVGIVAVIALIGFLDGFFIFINDFSQELKYLNIEIGRTDGAERRYWLRQRRRLWLSLIPFVKYRQD